MHYPFGALRHERIRLVLWDEPTLIKQILDKGVLNYPLKTNKKFIELDGIDLKLYLIESFAFHFKWVNALHCKCIILLAGTHLFQSTTYLILKLENKGFWNHKILQIETTFVIHFDLIYVLCLVQTESALGKWILKIYNRKTAH